MGPIMRESKIFDQPSLRLVSAKKRGFTLLAVISILTIYAGSGAVREVSNAIRRMAGDSLDLLVTAGLIVILALLIGYRRAAIRGSLLPLLVLVLAGYGLALWYLRVPEERFHLLQYGLVNLFIAGALPDKISGLRRHVAVIALACLAGIGDELIQALRPNRVGDLRDVLINGYSALLAQGLLVILTGKNGNEANPNLLRETVCD